MPQPSASMTSNFAGYASASSMRPRSPVAIGNGQTLEVVTSSESQEKYVVRDSNGTIIREFDSRESFEKFATNPYKRVAESPVSTFSSDVDTASYTVARNSLTNGRMPQKK